VTVHNHIEGTPTRTWYWTETIDSITFYVTSGPTRPLQPPSCFLPTSVSQCQQSWDDWVHQRKEEGIWERQDELPGCNPAATSEIPWSCKAAISSWELAQYPWRGNSEGEPPNCSQAKVAEDYCSYVRSVFLHNGERRGYYLPDAQSTATIIDGMPTSIMVWPSNSTLGGPGCTIGCGNCALQGKTVELIFWPPATSSIDETATIGPADLWTVETLGTTFTSPTVRTPNRTKFTHYFLRGLYSHWYQATNASVCESIDQSDCG